MTTTRARASWRDELTDLVLPRWCVGCGARSSWWCERCAPSLEGPSSPAALPIAGLPCRAAASYAGPAGAAVVAWKERGALTLRAPLALALARAVDAVWCGAGSGGGGSVVLVPVPSRLAATRARGHDAVAVLARAAARELRRSLPDGRGADVRSVAALVHRRRVVDQSGLGPVGRAANVAGAFGVRRRARAVLEGRAVIVVDDVVTTGSSLAEAARALACLPGVRVLGAATVTSAADRGTPR